MGKVTLSELRAAVAAGPPYASALLERLQGDSREGARKLYEQCRRREARAIAQQAHLNRMLFFEREAHAGGHRCVAGVDEAGRGPLAGPIVAAAVVLDEPLADLNDSKQLTADQRDQLFARLEKGAHRIGVAIIPPDTIDHQGIQTANYMAMAQAAAALNPPADFLLVDGFAIPGCALPQKRLVKGDARSMSIAAASIIAKVTRDRIMHELDRQYPEYGFARHKGYATAEHLEAVQRLGPCPAHRRSFAPLADQAITAPLFLEQGGTIA